MKLFSHVVSEFVEIPSIIRLPFCVIITEASSTLKKVVVGRIFSSSTASMKPLNSWRSRRAIRGLFLLPFAVAESPFQLRPSGAGDVHVRNAGVAERRPHDTRFRRHPLTKNASTTLSSSDRGTNESSFIKRSRPSEPRLPEYPVDNGRRRGSFADTQPHVMEPESDDVDSIWERHASTGEEVELPHENHEEELAHSPVVYQYFGRSRSRVHTADSIPFILLGPTVDHWKTVGQTLASRGFSVMACEIVESEKSGDPEEGKNLILAILDALRWNRAIIVGCDSKAMLAIEAAIQLAPDRVKGLVLCGDLTAADQMARRAAALDTERLTKSNKQEDKKRHIALDSLLNAYLECPYTLVWDGDVAQAPKGSGDYSGDMFRFNRCLILGGGTAPHRRRPEQFAWTLTRFVEEKVAPRSVPLQIRASENGNRGEKQGYWKLPGVLENVFSQGSLLVTGRILASLIFYVTAMKIAVYQYESLRGGVVSINSLVQYVNSSKQKVLQSFASFFRNPFVIFSLLGRRRSSRVGSKAVVIYEGNALDETGKSSDEEDVAGSHESASETEEEQPIDDEHIPQEESSPEPPADESKDENESKDAEEQEQPRRLMLLDLVVV